MAESKFTQVPLAPLAKLPVVQSTEVGGFFQASTQLEEAAQKNFKNIAGNEATRQGIVDGQQGKFNTELLYAPTFRGKAYTRAAQKSFLDTVELNATQKIQQIVADNPNDSAGARKQISSYLNGVVSGFPEKVRQRVGQTFLLKSQIRANVGLNGILTRERRQFTLQQEAQALEKDNQRSIDVVRNAESILSDDPAVALKSVAAVIEQRAQIESDYGAKITDPEGNQIGAFNPVFRLRALQQFDIDTSNAAIKSSFKQSNNKEEYLRQFEANEIDLRLKDEQGRVVLDMRPNVRRKAALIRYMQAEISREGVQRNAALRNFRGEVKADINTLKTGGQLTDERISSMKTRAHQLGDEESFELMSDWINHNNDMHQMSVMTPSNLDAVVGAERADMENRRDGGESISQIDVEQLEAKESLLSNMSSELDKDQLEWANHVGLIEKSPIIPTAQETVNIGGVEVRPQELMNKRVAQAEAVGAHYGRPPQYLTDEEKTTFQKFLTDRNTGPDAKLSLLASLNGFGDRQDEVLAEISPKAPEYMHIGGMMRQGSQPSVLSDAMEGLAIIQGAGTIKGERVMQTGSSDVTEVTDNTLGSAYQESAQTRKQVVNVAEAIYTARMFRRGKTDVTDFDSDEWQKALQEASGANFIEDTQFGGVTEYNDKQVHIPSWMEAGEFEDFINALTDDDWRVGGFGGPPIFPRANGEVEPASMNKERDIFSDFNLTSIGNGQYIVARNVGEDDPRFYRAQVDPTSPVAAVRNGFYVLDLNQIPSGRRTRAMQAARLSFVRTPESSSQEVPEDLEGVTTFPELVEEGKGLVGKGKEIVKDQIKKTGELIQDFKELATSPEAEELLNSAKEKLDSITSDFLPSGPEGRIKAFKTISQAFDIIIKSMNAFFPDNDQKAGLPPGLRQEMIDIDERGKELRRNRAAFLKLPKSKRTEQRENELNKRSLVLSQQTKDILKRVKERNK